MFKNKVLMKCVTSVGNFTEGNIYKGKIMKEPGMVALKDDTGEYQGYCYLGDCERAGRYDSMIFDDVELTVFFERVE